MTPAIDYRYVRFPIGGALDTKTDPAVVDRPAVVQNQNTWMDRSGSLSKRYGYVDLAATVDILGTSVPTFAGLAPLGSESFIAFSHDYAWAYIPSLNRYTPIGSGVSASVEVRQLLSAGAATVRSIDHASVSNYTLFASHEDLFGADAVRWILMDGETVLASGTQSSSKSPRVVSLGSRLYLFYGGTATDTIRVLIFDCTSAATLATSLGAAAVLVTSDWDRSLNSLDVAANTTYGVFLAYASTTANTLKWGFVSTAGALASTSTVVATAPPTRISCAVSPGLAMHGIVYAYASATNNVFAVLRSWNGAVWTATATSGAIDTAVVFGVTVTACAWESNNTTLTLWYSDAPATGEATHQGSYTTAGVATARAFTIERCCLASKPFSYNSVWYAMVRVTVGAQERQSNLIIVSLSGVVLTGRPLSGTPVAIIADNGHAISGELIGRVTTVSAGRFRLGFMPRLTPGNNFATSLDLQTSSSAQAIVDFQSPAAHKSVQVGGVTYISGAVLTQYDGGVNGVVEVGFLRAVDGVTAAAGGSGALTASSSYSYHVIPEYMNSAGAREQGTNFGPVTIALGVGETDVTLTIPTIAATMKDLIFAIYRTESNGTVYYRIGTVANSRTAKNVTYYDEDADADITSNESFPYADGVLLDNSPTPAGHIMGYAAGRMFVASTAIRGLIHASKQHDAGEPIAFNDALTIQVPDDGGDITAFAQLSGALVVFTERSIFRVAGEGPNNVGEGQWLTPERLSVDTGCTNQLSVVETPAGIMFRGTKGFYLIDQSFQLQYIGAPLENAFTEPLSDNPTGLLVPDRQQVRWSDSDSTVVFDYFHRQWSKWTFAWEGPTVLIAGVQYAPLGDVFRETEGTYADDGVAYEMKVKLAPFKDPGGLGGQTRAKRVGVVGEAAGSFTLTVTAQHDYATATSQTLTWPITAGQFFAKDRLMTKILAGLSLTVSDGGVAGAGMRLQEVAVEIGQRVAGKTLKR